LISAQAKVVRYLCSGSTRFDFPYKILTPGQLRVVREATDRTLTDLVLSGGYTLEGVGHAGGVTVTTTQAYADGRLILWLDVPAVQTIDYVENDAFAAESHETALDRLTLMIGQTRGDLDQAVRFPIGEAGKELPPIEQRAGRFWASAVDGSLIFVPGIRGDDIVGLDGASIYFDYNTSSEPRLVLNTSGEGSVVREGVPNPGGCENAVVMLQDEAPLINHGQARIWFSSNFKGWDADHPELAQAQIDNKHSRGVVAIAARSEISAGPVGPDPEHPTGYLPQEVGCLTLVATAAAATKRAKVEALIVSAREEPDMAGPSKGVAIQAITVRNTQGPDPDDRTQITDNDDGEVETGEDVRGVGSFTIRCNGGTVNHKDTPDSLAEPTYGGYRSWGALVAGGRAGYLNGMVLGKRHHFQGDQDPERDFEEVGGWGGVWGGRGFWHDNAFATYAKDSCPGWVTIGHDGVPVTDPEDPGSGNAGLARAPLDIMVDLSPPDAVPAAWNDPDTGGAVLSFNGDRLLGPRKTGWTVPGGTGSRAGFDTSTATLTQVAQTLKALIEDLYGDDQKVGHGLIGE
jgi:hypothetical protein